MKNRNSIVLTLLLVISLLATACSSAAAGTSTDGAATANAAGDLNEATRLALGILSLEETEQVIITEQAEQLLTLWQAYQALGNSETTAAVELEALVDQIKATLTTEQVNAIDAMNLTSESMTEVMQAFGGQFTPGGMPGAQSTPQAGSDFEGFQGGEMPEGGFPPAGGEGFGGGGPGGGMRAGGGDMPMGGDMGGAMGLQGTPGAMDQNRFNSLGSQVNPMLLRVLISMLETKVGASK
jgi:hypothetical protein